MTPADRFIVGFDRALRTVFARQQSTRAHPGAELAEADLSVAERQHAAALMRVNHVGEVCAQALYQGQALTSRTEGLRQSLEHAAYQETEHLAWTARRIDELGGRTSLLNPLWYLGALGIGVAAGVAGDKWNLGFLAETERQVEAHLDGHLGLLPAADQRSKAVIEQMKSDEIEHAETAVRLGAADLPAPVRFAMRAASRVMTSVAYYV